MSITINPPAGPWTVSDLADVPDTGHRYEIHEGNLVIMSPVTLWHSRIMRRLAAALDANGLAADAEVGVRRSHRSTRIADVAVFHKAPTDLRQAFWPPEDLALVVEIVSESSAEDDRFTKPRWYAAAGIAEYWRVERSEDPTDATVAQFTLETTADGSSAYVESGVTRLSALEKGQGSNL